MNKHLDSTDYLLSLPRFAGRRDRGFKPGLDRIRHLLDEMQRPQEDYGIVHVAGTNGKGSTAAGIASICTADNQRVGLHTSPHLFTVTERMRVDGEPAPGRWLEQAVDRYRSLFDAVKPSFFEATVALSLLYFAECEVDVAVVEVGLGGRLDATNIVTPVLCLITNIGRDHRELLGDTLPEIAREKAGIIKPRVPVLTAVEDPEALDVIREVAERQESPVHLVRNECQVSSLRSELDRLTLDVQTPIRAYKRLEVGLAGAHQAGNALLGIRAGELMRASTHAIRRGLRDVREVSGLGFRMQVLHREPLVVADVAHNVEALEATLRHLRTFHSGSLTVLLGMLRDKDLRSLATLLREADAVVIPADFDAARALPPGVLASRLEAEQVPALGPQRVGSAVREFIERADQSDVLLVTGSHHVVTELPDQGRL